MFGSDRKHCIWRENGERLNEKYMTPTVKFFGGKIFLWRCFSFDGVGNLNFIEGTMDKYQYVDILINNIASSAEKMGLNEYIFQQDNDPKHTSAYAREFFTVMEIAVLDWPSQSPDLNPIEHLWAYMKNQMCGFKAKSKIDLKSKIVEFWNSIPLSLCQKLVLYMKKRIIACIKSRGNHIHY